MKSKQAIHGFDADLKTVEAHPQISEGFCGIDIRGKHYEDKQEAGEVILALCKESKATEPISIGSYRGFQMELSFDSFRHEFDIVLKGSMSHRVSLGSDARGNLIRLDNSLAGIPERLEKAKDQLTNLYNQQEATQAELGKPFPQEAELTAKSQRLAELDAALNMDDHAGSHDEEIDSDRPSVLADLKAKSETIPPAHRHSDCYKAFFIYIQSNTSALDFCVLTHYWIEIFYHNTFHLSSFLIRSY